MSDPQASAPGDAPTGKPKTVGRKPGKSASKSARSRAREFALQALYQVIVGKNEAADIDLFTRDLSGFHKADSAHYDALLMAAPNKPQIWTNSFCRCWTAAWLRFPPSKGPPCGSAPTR